jgi:hypothetical protein
MNVSVGWYCLRFELDQPQYYAYSYSATGTLGAAGDTFLAQANGDLNGDGILSTFTLGGLVDTSMILNVAPNIGETAPEE